MLSIAMINKVTDLWTLRPKGTESPGLHSVIGHLHYICILNAHTERLILTLKTDLLTHFHLASAGLLQNTKTDYCDSKEICGLRPHYLPQPFP